MVNIQLNQGFSVVPTKLLSFTLLFFVQSLLYSQDLIRLKGVVVEKESKELIPFVTVRLKGVALGTITEEDGHFAIKIPIAYAKDTLVFSSVGFIHKEMPVAFLKEGIENRIILDQYVAQLEEVIVQRGRERDPLKILKKALRRIDNNYPQNTFYFDAYYRERIEENGAAIKFADASTTFQQSGYDGKRFRQGMGFSGIGSVGLFSSSFILSTNAGERLHDHFGHNTSWQDRVKVHDSRSSLNLTKEGLQANIEGGPLALLSKDLVRYISYITDKKQFKNYEFELLELPDENGDWDFVVRFFPAKKPASLEGIMADQAKNKRISRTDILSGSIYIDQESYAIKKMSYGVEQDYRRHICNLQEMNIKHYGYNVDVDYMKVGKRWQVEKIKKVDQFIVKDTVKQTTTPYSTVSELFVTDYGIKKGTINRLESFSNSDFNALYEHSVEFNKDFWEEYERNNPIAQIEQSIRKDMEGENKLEQQFILKHIRDPAIAAPIAMVRSETIELHGETLKDDYAWLKDTKEPKSNKEVMDYLAAENAFAQNYFIDLKKMDRTITKELVVLTEDNEPSEPIEKNGYLYWSQYEGDNEYSTIYRKSTQEGAKEELLFDQTAMADSSEYFKLGFYSVSPDNRYLAYSVDTVGRNVFTTLIKEFETGEYLKDSISRVTNFLWSKEVEGYFYIRLEKNTDRPYQLFFHEIGEPFSNDVTYFTEKDPAFRISLSRSSTGDYLILNTSSNNSNALYITRDIRVPEFQLVKKAVPNQTYNFNNQGDSFYIMTNIEAPDKRLMRTDTASFQFDNWEELLAERNGVQLMDYEVYNDYLIFHKKEKMMERIEVLDRSSQKTYTIKENPGEVFTMGLGKKKDPDSLIYYVSAPDLPTTRVSYHLRTNKSQRKRLVDPKFALNFLIKTKLLWAEGRDGTNIPISMVFFGTKDKYIQKRSFLIQTYGAYGIQGDLSYNESMAPLLIRGLVYAYIHVRGGSELGSDWYESGRKMNKQNSMNDFIDGVDFLVREGYANKDLVYANSGSAGGLLLASVVNQRPDLLQGVFLDVPFVDPINTMLDEKLPLTSGEFSEWGNPKNKNEFKYMLEYSPYENVKPQSYPNMSFGTSLNDPKVGYWEAAKLVAKIRANRVNDNALLLRTSMSGGHSGPSGKMAAIRSLSYMYSLLFYWQDQKRIELINRSLNK
jgi:protease II